MADQEPSNRAPASGGCAPAIPDAAAEPLATLDAHGFNPDDYDWIPFPRERRRSDGWTMHTQRQFIESLADTGSVGDAARAVGMSRQSCYRLRRLPEAQGFARAWDAAIEQAGKALLDLAFERIIHGEDVPVFNKEGQRIASKQRFSDRLTMFLLRAYFPDRFGADRLGGVDDHARRTVSQPAAEPPIEAALAALEPVCPAEPHTLMPPDELAEFIEAEAFNAAEEERAERLERERPERQPKVRKRFVAAREEPVRWIDDPVAEAERKARVAADIARDQERDALRRDKRART